MNRQTLQAKESAPAKKKSSFSWLRPAAAHPAAETEHEAPSASSPAFAHDFTKVPVRPMQLPGVPGFSCPFAPQRCPSGGACHTCPPKMQAKLKIGQPGDRYEQEADRVAETVMRMPEPQVQRKGCSAPGCKDEDEDKLVQTKSAGSAGNAQVDHPLIQSVLSSPGQPLDAGTRSFMEPRFGQDFSGVRVHVGGQAAESARAVNARAYTVGRDVVFGEGQYAPGSDEGKRLVAHELAHVGQQSLVQFPHIESLSRLLATDISMQCKSSPPKKKSSKPKSPNEERADFVTKQVAADNFIAQSVPLPEGQFGPPAFGGAFWLLNGLNPRDLNEVIFLCGKEVRAKLLDHLADTEGYFDRPRLGSALRSVAWAEKTAGTSGIEIMDAIRNAGTGSFAGVWSLLAGKSRVKIIGALRTLPRTMLTQLQTKLSEAPAADLTNFTEVISDLLGTGTDMQANDVIDLKGLSGIDRVMASIYNLRGQLIEEQAHALGIPTHAAAGIMKVESGGQTFSEATDKTIIRFENHVFWKEWGKTHSVDFNDHFDFDRETGGRKWELHRFRDSSTGTWEACHQDQAQEWRIMEFAARLSSQEAAYRSASWGAGQIMGFNSGTVGYGSAVEMAEAFNKAERPQVTGIFRFILMNSLVSAINSGDYLTVAKKYNGNSAQATTYASRMQAAALAYKKVTQGKVHVI